MNEEKQIGDMAQIIAKNVYGEEQDASYTPNARNAKELFSNGYRKPKWISVEERLPDQDGKYLAYTRRCFTALSYYYALEDAFGFEHWDVTHWMPLPMPPKGDEGK